MNLLDTVNQALNVSYLYSQVSSTLTIFFSWFPYWGPIFLGYLFLHQWLHYVEHRYLASINWVMLEIKIPKETYKSPLAMEIVLNALYQSAAGVVWWDKWWKGKVKDYFSLEMVSLEGNIKFFIRTPWIYKNVIEAQLYGQYPDIEIYEVPDYTLYVDYRGKEGDWESISTEYVLSKPDPYPIKTYIDYGLDKDPKEELKVDPLTSVIEYLGSMGKGEQLWIQILVQSASKHHYRIKTGKNKGKIGTWQDEGKDIIAELAGRTKDDDPDAKFQVMKLTKGEQEVISAIERSLGKLGFDAGVRAVYLAKRDKFHPSNIKALGGLLRPFNSSNLNGFKISTQSFGFDFPWQDYKNFRVTRLRKKLFEAYKHRVWFHTPRKLKTCTLTSEELATIYHFPGGVAQTPTFGRITSSKSEAPVNLPI